MYIKRFITADFLKKIEPNMVVVLFGPRQVGKTTFLEQEILPKIKEEYLFVSGETISVQKWLSSQEVSVFQQKLGSIKMLIIDEAQKVPNIGLNLKLMVDHIKGLKIIATGSSSFALANQVGEPLVGRQWQFELFPLAQLELSQIENRLETEANLPLRLIYGSYPRVITSEDREQKKEILQNIVDHYLYKDLLEFGGIKKAQKIIDLLTLLAFQIGQEVSLQELSNSLNLNIRTVEKYLDLLEKTFVIKRVFGFSRNLRKEITKNSRFYFYDNGVRNAIIKNFNDLPWRDDVGQLWENYLFMERFKKRAYKKIFANQYFWRTWDKKEIDLVEEREGKLFAYEFKWNLKKKIKAPAIWLKTYPNASWELITPENYLDFIT